MKTINGRNLTYEIRYIEIRAIYLGFKAKIDYTRWNLFAVIKIFSSIYISVNIIAEF